MTSRCLTGGDSTSIQEDQDVGAQLTGSDGTQVAGSGQRQPVRVAPELHHVGYRRLVSRVVHGDDDPVIGPLVPCCRVRPWLSRCRPRPWAIVIVVMLLMLHLPPAGL